MKRIGNLHRILLLTMLTAFILPVTGCTTTGDPKNTAHRPWNAPKSWESGAPGMLVPDRRY
ncbi:MAG: hypothetical protein ACJASX_003887 [Limisphaerales bacterium]|jgi:hypothetical protein